LNGGGGGGGGRFFDSNGASREAYGHGSFLNFARLSYELSGGEHVSSPYSENVFVKAAVKAFADGVGRMRFGLWNGDPSQQDAERVPDRHPLMRLLRRPNRSQTEKQLWRAHTSALKLEGESHWFLATADGRPLRGSAATGVLTQVPRQIIQAGGSSVKIEYGKDGRPKTLRYRLGSPNGGESEPFPWYSVVSFAEFNPESSVRGLGDAETAIRPIDIQHQIIRYLDASLRNGGAPSGVLIFDEALAPSELERRQSEVDDDLNIENAGRIKVFDRKAKFYPSNFTPKDFEYEKLWRAMTSAILTSLGAPEPVVGIFENATYENVRTAYLEFWRGANGVLALADGTTDIITHSLIPRLSRVWRDTPGLVAAFDHSSIEVLQEDFISELTLAREISQSGIGVSFNEALGLLGTRVGLTESGDKHWVKAGMTDLDTGDVYSGAAPRDSEQARLIAVMRQLQEEAAKE